MKVIGAGLPRTGTMSTRAALEILGFKTYHMEEVLKNFDRGDTDKWNALFEGTSNIEWNSFFSDYDALVDAPVCFFYKELMAVYPDAIVLLNERNPENWYSSVKNLNEIEDKIEKHLTFIPRLKGHIRLTYNWKTALWGRKNRDRDNLIASFQRHNEEVRAAVPPERLLVFKASEGWEPLCERLGVPVPDEPFPHLNKGSDLDKTAAKVLLPLLIKDMLKMYWPFIIGIIAIVVLLIFIL